MRLMRSFGASALLLALLPLATLAGGESSAPADVQRSLDQTRIRHVFLGAAKGAPEAVPGGYQLPCQNGVVYYDSSQPSATSEVHGEILAKYLALGGPSGLLGFPRTSQSAGANGVGSYNHFANGSIYSFALLGAFMVQGTTRDKWVDLGAESGVLGFPKTDSQVGPRGGFVCEFQYGLVCGRSDLGAHYVTDVLFQRWLDAGGLTGAYGYPVEDPAYTSGVWSQRFEGGTIAANGTGRDLRTEIARRGIEVRDQGPRGTCSIFAMTFLLEYAYAEMLGPTYDDLSEEYLNHVANRATDKTCDGDVFSGAADGYRRYGIVQEASWPYNPDLVYNYSSTRISGELYEAGQTMLQDGLRLEGHFVVPLGEPGATTSQWSAILSYLARGVPVAIGRGHSMAAVGYQMDSGWEGGGYLILRNSYGPEANEEGYLRESFASVKRTVCDAYVYEQPYRQELEPSLVPLEGESVGGDMAQASSSGPLRYEAEALSYSSTGPEPGRQDMAGFSPFPSSPRWSNDAQLYWGAGPDTSLTLYFSVPQAGRYDVWVYVTLSPYFDTASVEIDGRETGAILDEYGTDVRPSGPIEVCSGCEFAKGKHRVRFTIVSTNSASLGHGFGVDCVELRP